MDAVRVAAGVIVRDGRVLVCQRRQTDRHPGKWEFPGGKLEPGETPEACIRRELREELGIDVEVGRQLWSTRHGYPEIEVELVFLRIASPETAPQNLCFADLRWVTLAELESLDFLDADRGFVSQVVRGEIAL